MNNTPPVCHPTVRPVLPAGATPHRGYHIMRSQSIQIEAHRCPAIGERHSNDQLRAAGVRRIHRGWYTLTWTGVVADPSTVTSAQRNRRGEIIG